MELRLDRLDATADRTIGDLSIEDQHACWTLEDELDDGSVGHAILPGRYRVIITFSNRFQRPLPLLVGVPGRFAIRIHSGNTEADTTGCVLVGFKRGPDNVEQSLLALVQLEQQIAGAIDRGEDVWIDVRNTFETFTAKLLTMGKE